MAKMQTVGKPTYLFDSTQALAGLLAGVFCFWLQLGGTRKRLPWGVAAADQFQGYCRGYAMNNVIPFHYQGQPVRFNTEGWINATDVAKRFGKRPVDWLKQIETKEYLSVLAEALTCDAESLVETSKARADRGGGTWFHPKLAVAFARWLDLKFAVWCDLHIDALLRGELTEKQQLDRACRALEDGRKAASASGRALAQWKMRKPALECQVDHWRHQLQLTLGLELV